MQLVQIEEDIMEYLERSQILDYHDPSIQKKALELSLNSQNQTEIAKNVYEFVRDEIPHALDIGGQIVTFKASEVLKEGQGLCFAKSNLLAALLRFLEIPTGFCYQKLNHENGYIWHGLNAVFLDGGWHRLDARGNREDVDAQFSLDTEKLAFPVSDLEEKDYPGIYSEPLEVVTESFKSVKTVDEIMEILVDELVWEGLL
ncbi:MAG: transglutaminase-like domain-containing protein [Methanobacterium paludis]|nr:transglutaminase-like domain-containing protein [Methanobacterium paludis]